jgi:hypothetical protein
MRDLRRNVRLDDELCQAVVAKGRSVFLRDQVSQPVG